MILRCPLGVLWDFDGVIGDTEEAHFQAWSRACGQFNLPMDRPTFMKGFGMNNRDALAEVMGEQPDDDFVARFVDAKEALFRELIPTTRMFPGAADWLAHFQTAGIKQVLASSGPQINLDALMAHFNLAQHFDAVVSGSNLKKGKPHPEIFINAAASVSLNPRDCLVIEDSAAGVASGHDAGALVLAFTHTKPASELARAHIVRGTYADAEDILAKAIKKELEA